MACPVNQRLPTGAFLPIIKKEKLLDNTEGSILFVDNYSKFYKRFNVFRDEMMVIMPSMMISDVLSGVNSLDYYMDE
jgi:hypothetical protein